MGVDTFSYGDDLKCFCKLQSAFGTALKPAATDAFRALSFNMGQVPDRPDPGDRRGTRSRMEAVAGRSIAEWDCEVIFRPSGTLGVAPDIGDMLKLALGTETTVASTSVTYSLLKDMTALYASLYTTTDALQELVYDAIVQTLNISWKGDDFVKLKFDGQASVYGKVAKTDANGAGSGATALIVDDADFLCKYGIIQIGGDDNSSAGYQITALDHSTETATIDPSATWSNEDDVELFLPTPTYTGDPIYGTDGSVSLDGGSTTVKFLSGDITLKTGLELLNNEYGDAEPSDVIMPNKRELDFNLSMLLREDRANLNSLWQRKQSDNVRITCGDTATKRMKINMTDVEIMPGKPSTPESGMAELSVSGVAFGTSGEDELTLLFD